MSHVLIDDKRFPVVLAITAAEQEKGLMYHPPPTPVMAFVYDEPRINSFWMKNTISSLDILFALKGRVVGIRKGIPHSLQVVGSDLVSDLVVEFPAGTCALQSITVGSKISLEMDKSAKMKLFMAKNHIW